MRSKSAALSLMLSRRVCKLRWMIWVEAWNEELSQRGQCPLVEVSIKAASRKRSQTTHGCGSGLLLRTSIRRLWMLDESCDRRLRICSRDLNSESFSISAAMIAMVTCCDCGAASGERRVAIDSGRRWEKRLRLASSGALLRSSGLSIVDGGAILPQGPFPTHVTTSNRRSHQYSFN